MKRKLYIIVALMLLCSLMLTSCGLVDTVKGWFGNGNGNEGGENEGGDNGGENPDDEGSGTLPDYSDKEEWIDIIEDEYAFALVGDDDVLCDSFNNLLYRIELLTGKAPEVKSESEANVIVKLCDYTEFGASYVVGRCTIGFEDGKLYITAGDVESLNFAKDRLLSFAKDGGIVIPADMNESFMFNILNYRIGKTTVYTESDLKNMTLLYGIDLGSEALYGFSPIITSYSVKIEDGEDYPLISATPVNPDATVDIEQAGDENMGIAKINVRAGSSERIYRVSFFSERASVMANIVNKNGAKGTICFVIDDGTESTATFMLNNILGKEGYENITASFAIITKKIANIETETNEEGKLTYKIDDNGKYAYTEIDGKFDFWREILATDKAYVLSHTHTHTYEGDNDNGGVFRYKKNDGTYVNTPYFPIGNVTMELVASNQIIKDLSGEDDSVGFIIPGVGAAHSGYFNNLFLNCGEYVIARGTAGSTSVIKDYETIIYHPEELTDGTLKSVKSYMIEHFLSSPDGSTNSESTNEECLAAGIQNWKDFMDAALAGGGWASFCIHEIRPDNYKGNDHHIYESQAKELFAYANAYGSDAWIASYNDAAKYFMEWSKSTVKTELYDNRVIAATLECDIDDERFDEALTVKIEIPDSWQSASLAGNSLEIKVDDSGVRYVLVDFLPGESLEIVATGYNAEEDNTGAMLFAD